jgi:hypothetical protein
MIDRWIQTVHPKKGALHRALYIPLHEHIPFGEEHAIERKPIGSHYHSISVTPHLKKMVNFAINVRKR